MLHGKTVLLGVSGGIAAYKAVEITSRLVKLGATVHVLMTEAATKLVGPLTFQAISGQPVRVELLGAQNLGHVDHVALTHQADLMIVAPATANTIAKLAAGMADDWITITGLAVQCPKLLCPAMEAEMWASPLTQRNVAALEGVGWTMMAPAEGRLASGLTGQGRLREPAEIVDAAIALLTPPATDLAGCTILVTAGTTREALDPVRYIGNRATGKMGYAIAEAALQRGAQVTLVTGPSDLTPPAGANVVRIESALQMLEACQAHFPGAQITIGAAAPADYRPAVYHEQKIKKQGDETAITLLKNPDIMKALGEAKQPGQVVVSFAAETQSVVEFAREKLHKKRSDFVVANDVTAAGAGFGTDTNRVTFVFPNHEEELPLLSKRAVADRILDRAVALRNGGNTP
ncbi:MAG TPA: bifunctional phosphopantothenoylcysteine decarboxylase/phosphopantothenate--cysteine ligase CoaBC [Symbiobacteriaceae bacterium]|nr:bifunctional phosphopantothenoylcysteine decarboxylase/phosphopantothenate--cysteine ligase CoaBC [Symbiobacteriaceae bacterium]